MTILVGKNDSGKSNVLRALNLFFNEQTNHGTAFSFAEDYNFFAPERKGKAEEIEVELEIALPESYHGTNGQLIVWKKVWRSGGLHGDKNNYHGIRLTESERGTKRREKIDIPPMSNAHALLRQISFEYIPAVRGPNFFDDLQGRIYKTVSQVAAQSFRETSSTFEQSIGEHLEDLTKGINRALGIDTKLALPRDLSHIFERLDFLSGDKNVSLENRGDGIKARHVPQILKFMANKKKMLQVKGTAPFSFIWGYEEPENNLEFGSAIKLADELLEVSKKGPAQVFLTTHSPAFYDLKKQQIKTSLYHVYRASDEAGTKADTQTDGLDSSLGTLAVLAPRMQEAIEEIRNRDEATKLVEEQAARETKIVYVEGESDKVILERALALFFPAAKDKIHFDTKPEGAGHSYVLDMLSAWRNRQKHHPEMNKAAGIVDGDANTDKEDFNKIPDNIKSAKCFCYPKARPIKGALAKGFKVVNDLESIYPPEIWEWANVNGWLECRNKLDVYPKTAINDLLDRNPPQEDLIDDGWAVYVECKFKYDKKITCARQIAKKTDDEVKKILVELQPFLKEVLQYLKVEIE